MEINVTVFWLLESPLKGPVIRSFDILFDVSLNKLFEQTLEWPEIGDDTTLMWRYRNVN